MAIQKENYTLKEVVELGILPYSWRTLRRMIGRGEINAQAFVLGKRPRYMVSRTELERVQVALQTK